MHQQNKHTMRNIALILLALVSLALIVASASLYVEAINCPLNISLGVQVDVFPYAFGFGFGLLCFGLFSSALLSRLKK